MTNPIEPQVSRHKDLGALQDLLLRACPPDENGRVSIPALAGHLGLSNAYLYSWIDQGRIRHPKHVQRLVELGDGRVSFEDFHPYIFG